FDTGLHDTTACGGAVVLPAYAAVNLGTARAVTRVRFLLHAAPMKGFVFQGSNDSTNGSDGSWTTIAGPFDMPSGHELTWWEMPSFTNTQGFSWYRIYSTTTPG